MLCCCCRTAQFGLWCREVNLCVGAPAALFRGVLGPGDKYTHFFLDWVSVCRCMYVCVHPLKGMGELASHRSVSVLLWQSGDLRCMASCDPDSLLLSPPAPPHWHSGTSSSSERGKDEREGERKKRTGWDREGVHFDAELKMKNSGSRKEVHVGYFKIHTWEQRVRHSGRIEIYYTFVTEQ